MAKIGIDSAIYSNIDNAIYSKEINLDLDSRFLAFFYPYL